MLGSVTSQFTLVLNYQLELKSTHRVFQRFVRMAKSHFILFHLLCILFLDLVQGNSNEARIVGGELAAEGEFPWQVSLRAPGRHFCSGSLVSLQHVLTAGHCVTGRSASSIIAVTGTNSLASGGEEHAVRTIFIHAQYQSPAPAYHISDVAVLVLDVAIIESPLQRPIILPIDEAPDGAEVVVSGWGRTLPGNEGLPTELQKLSVTIINRTECQSQWGNVEIRIDHLCGVQEYGAGVCNGDSGGALVYDNQVVGIVSWANPCGFDYPDVYTHVFPHLYWIGWYVYNTETEITTPSGNNQVSLNDGNHVLHILCIYAVARMLFFSE